MAHFRKATQNPASGAARITVPIPPAPFLLLFRPCPLWPWALFCEPPPCPGDFCPSITFSSFGAHSLAENAWSACWKDPALLALKSQKQAICLCAAFLDDGEAKHSPSLMKPALSRLAWCGPCRISVPPDLVRFHFVVRHGLCLCSWRRCFHRDAGTASVLPLLCAVPPCRTPPGELLAPGFSSCSSAAAASPAAWT